MMAFHQGPSNVGLPSGVAPWYRVPATEIVSVEHPCVVKNLDNGLKMLGGDTSLGKVIGRNGVTLDLDEPVPTR